MNQYIFEMLVRGIVEADSEEVAREVLEHISINSDAGDYDIYVDEVCDIQFSGERSHSPREYCGLPPCSPSVSVSESEKKHAEHLRKGTGPLTDSEKRQAFEEALIEEVNQNE